MSKALDPLAIETDSVEPYRVLGNAPAQTGVEIGHKPNAETETETESKAKIKAKTEIEPKTEPEPESEAQAEAEPRPKPSVEPITIETSSVTTSQPEPEPIDPVPLAPFVVPTTRDCSRPDPQSVRAPFWRRIAWGLSLLLGLMTLGRLAWWWMSMPTSMQEPSSATFALASMATLDRRVDEPRVSQATRTPITSAVGAGRTPALAVSPAALQQPTPRGSADDDREREPRTWLSREELQQAFERRLESSLEHRSRKAVKSSRR